MRIAVVGHLEWVELVRVERVPRSGDIVHGEPLVDVPAGGGAVAAVQLARWGAEALFFTSLGDDALGHRAHDELRARGVQVHATFRPEPQRRAVTLIDPQRDRTILVIGDRLVPHGADALPWDELATCDAVYITGGDTQAIRAARHARAVVATSRILPALREAAIEVDALVGSEVDPDERYRPGDLVVAPRMCVRTDGARGGWYALADGVRHAYTALPVEITGDTYGCGDTFAAALTYALGERRPVAEAVDFAAARAAEVVTFVGPYPPTT